jgi:hypothetical protein
MATKEFDKYVLGVLTIALRTNNSYSYIDDRRIDEDVAWRLDELTGERIDLWDEQKDAKEIGDTYLIKKIDRKIIK